MPQTTAEWVGAAFFCFVLIFIVPPALYIILNVYIITVRSVWLDIKRKWNYYRHDKGSHGWDKF